MPTTTIRLPEDLKARVTAAAKRAGTTIHGFILEAYPGDDSYCWRGDPEEQLFDLLP